MRPSRHDPGPLYSRCVLHHAKEAPEDADGGVQAGREDRKAGAIEDKAVSTRAKDKHKVLDQSATMEKEATKQHDDLEKMNARLRS